MLRLAREAGAPDEVPRSGRRGFTLAEILVALMILATMAAVTIPVVLGRLRAANTAAVAGELQTLRDAILNYQSRVGRYPNRLSYLTLLPASGVTDPCGGAYTTTQYTAWRGPYVTRPITTWYIIADGDTVDNPLARTPSTATANVNNYLQINVYGVDSVMARDVQAQLDGDGNFGQGAILWVVVSGKYGKLTYQIPIAGVGSSGC